MLESNNPCVCIVNMLGKVYKMLTELHTRLWKTGLSNNDVTYSNKANNEFTREVCLHIYTAACTAYHSNPGYGWSLKLKGASAVLLRY